jgi:hypothetical protein
VYLFHLREPRNREGLWFRIDQFAVPSTHQHQILEGVPFLVGLFRIVSWTTYASCLDVTDYSGNRPAILNNRGGAVGEGASIAGGREQSFYRWKRWFHNCSLETERPN